MNTHNPDGDDAPLDRLLHEWKPKSSLPPRFQEQVWRRIERAATAPAQTFTLADLFTAWLASSLPRPALATAYVAVLLAIGAGAGWNQARQETVRVTTELGVRYVQSVDPYQATP